MKRLFLLLTLCSLSVLSSEKQFYGTKTFATLESSQDAFVLRHFEILSDGWQELKETLYFKSETLAVDFLHGLNLSENNTNTFSQKRSQAHPQGEGNATLLWSPKNSWSLEWELKFSEWVQSEVDEEFFVRHQLSTDCADVAYMLRWIFARINSLPAANHLTGSGRIFSSVDIPTRFKHLPTHDTWHKDARFRAALDYLANNTFTHSLMTDSYPVSLDKNGISPGSFYLSKFGSTGHTQFLFKVAERESELPFLMISSTVPREVRKLQKHFLWSAQPEKNKAGLRRIKWATTRSLLPGDSSDLFSNEQYEIEYTSTFDFPKLLIKRLNPNFSFEGAIKGALNDIKNAYIDRKGVVIDGYDYCSKNPNACKKGTAGWENWSTPSRDKRIREYIDSLSELIRACIEGCQGLETYAQAISWDYSDEVTLDMLFSNNIFETELPSSDPNDSPSLRWAVEPVAYTQQLSSQLKSFIQKRTGLVEKGEATSKIRLSLEKLFSTSFAYQSYGPWQWIPTLKESLEKISIDTPFSESLNLDSLFKSFIQWSERSNDSEQHRWGLWTNSENSIQVQFAPNLLAANGLDYATRLSNESIKIQNLESNQTQTLNALEISPLLSQQIFKDETNWFIGDLRSNSIAPIEIPDLDSTESYKFNFFSESSFTIEETSGATPKRLCAVEGNQIDCLNLDIESKTISLTFASDGILIFSDLEKKQYHHKLPTSPWKTLSWLPDENGLMVNILRKVDPDEDILIGNFGRVFDLKRNTRYELDHLGKRVVRSLHLHDDFYGLSIELVDNSIESGVFHLSVNSKAELQITKISPLQGNLLQEVFNNKHLTLNADASILVYEIDSEGQITHHTKVSGDTSSVISSNVLAVTKFDGANPSVTFFDLNAWKILGKETGQMMFGNGFNSYATEITFANDQSLSSVATTGCFSRETLSLRKDRSQSVSTSFYFRNNINSDRNWLLSPSDSTTQSVHFIKIDCED